MSKKDDQRRAEKIALAWVLSRGGRHPVKSGGPRFQRVDIWAADVVAFLDDGIVAVQVTTGGQQAQSLRRIKLARIDWPTCAGVALMHVERLPGRLIAYQCRTDWYQAKALVEESREWIGFGEWVSVPRAWWDPKALDKRKRNE